MWAILPDYFSLSSVDITTNWDMIYLMNDELLQTIAEKVDRIQKTLETGPQEWFSIKKAAGLMGVSEKHVRRAVVGGTLPCSNVGSPDRAIYRISRKDIEDFMRKRMSGAIHTPREKATLPAGLVRHYSPERLERMAKQS
jgi:excisionase family DNA binding protein